MNTYSDLVFTPMPVDFFYPHLIKVPSVSHLESFLPISGVNIEKFSVSISCDVFQETMAWDEKVNFLVEWKMWKKVESSFFGTPSLKGDFLDPI